MAVSPFDSAIWRGLYGDAEIGPLFTDSAEIRAMLLVEGALARVQGRLGLIPETAAAAISRAAAEVMIDPAALADGTAKAGVSAPVFVEAFRAAMGAPEHAAYIHWGATSQDVVDSGLILRLRRAVEIIGARLARLDAALAKKAAEEAETVMAARTRGQIATPTSFGAKLAVWRAPLARCKDRLEEVKPRLLRISLAGASGNLAAMGPKGPEVASALAEELGLAHDPTPWHAARDSMAEAAALAALITGALGKIGLDAAALLQSEIREISAGAGGGSSTMPHKANPVAAESMIALARLNAGRVGQMFDAMLHGHERDGAAWAVEWFTLPQMIMAAGASLTQAEALIGAVEARPEAMAATIAATNGLMMAEAATFALAEYMPRPEAQALVKAACQEVGEGGLEAALRAATDAPVDWPSVLAPENTIGAAPQIARGGQE